MKLHSLFPITVFEDNIGSDTKEKSFIKKQKLERFSEDNGFISTEKNILEYEELASLKNKILKSINTYLKDVCLTKDSVNYYIEKSWITKHIKNDFSPEHYHTNSLISGCYYPETINENDNLIFKKHLNYNNLFGENLHLGFKEYNDINANLWYVKLTKGSLILFPSHLLHFTNKNLSNKERYCLAFNVYFKGVIGDSYLNTITI
tara:strand:+ start:516 stop:1130 length:615 start_codon:yes stop_codon:yes gene_type:complete